MTKWRPEGWENPYPTMQQMREFHADKAFFYDPQCRNAFDAGADAMLEALKQQFDSEHLESYQTHNMCNGCPGTWVFIPDEEVTNESR
jgi:hypothetical protein